MVIDVTGWIREKFGISLKTQKAIGKWGLAAGYIGAALLAISEYPLSDLWIALTFISAALVVVVFVEPEYRRHKNNANLP